MFKPRLRLTGGPRRGAILVLAALMLVVIFAFVAFTVDVGYMTITKAELQNAADSAALAGSVEIPQGDGAVRETARAMALLNVAAGAPVELLDKDIELGLFDFESKEFRTDVTFPNAVRVTTRVIDQPFFFAPVIDHDEFDMSASAIGMLDPRDIVFVVDLSGSMNDDTEPCWATSVISGLYSRSTASDLMQAVFSDFGFGPFPGIYVHLGAPLGVSADNYAYAELTKDSGPLTAASLPTKYRIANTDDEVTRKRKAYRWIIDRQISVLMPNARPVPDSGTNYAYWEKYLDYVISGVSVGQNPPSPTSSGGSGSGGTSGGSSGGGTGGTSSPKPPLGHMMPFPEGAEFGRPELRAATRDLGALASISNAAAIELMLNRARLGAVTGPGLPRNGSTLKVTLPPNQDGDRITGLNNPNKYTFPSASSSLPAGWRNKIGYLTYIQFMMDWGRDRSPDVSNSTNAGPAVGVKTPLSLLSKFCPMHAEKTAGGTFQFPPREQPMHACRRSLIAALNEVKLQNTGITPGAGDQVAVITFDGLDSYHAPQVVVPLTADFDRAMESCATLQAVSDIGATTATEAGLLAARNHLLPPGKGGAGREYATRIIVLLTDGVPNVWQSSQSDVDKYIRENSGPDYYEPDYIWLNAPLVQAARARAENTRPYITAMGLGADYDFLDRMARSSGTAEDGKIPRGSGNPAEYEQRLTQIFRDIIRKVGTRLVQ
jgi:hypothetical protein